MPDPILPAQTPATLQPLLTAPQREIPSLLQLLQVGQILPAKVLAQIQPGRQRHIAGQPGRDIVRTFPPAPGQPRGQRFRRRAQDQNPKPREPLRGGDQHGSGQIDQKIAAAVQIGLHRRGHAIA